MSGPQYVIAQIDDNGNVRPVGPDNPLKIASSGGGGGVDTVNGQTGDVVLDAADVNALPDTYTPPATTWASIADKPAVIGAGATAAAARTAIGAGTSSLTLAQSQAGIATKPAIAALDPLTATLEDVIAALQA